jgi:hypothetical protein
MEVKVPKRFIEDHSERECLRGEDGERLWLKEVVKRELKNHYVVELTEAQAKELHSDAEHYAWLGTRELGWHMGGLVASARATRDALRKVMAAQ